MRSQVSLEYLLSVSISVALVIFAFLLLTNLTAISDAVRARILEYADDIIATLLS